MADITMCATEGCKYENTCYRKLANVSGEWQSWSEYDCKDNKHYLEANI